MKFISSEFSKDKIAFEDNIFSKKYKIEYQISNKNEERAITSFMQFQIKSCANNI